MRFTKMHGIGNDYVYIDGFSQEVSDPRTLAIEMSEPHFGVGSDGLILILPSDHADFRMRMFNRDGSEGAMCGNGARCVGRYVYEHGLTDRTSFTLETASGIREISLRLVSGRVQLVTVDMGAPQALRVLEDCVQVSMGNPHAVYFISEDPFRMATFEALGKERCDALDANIEFVQALPNGKLRMRVYERGSGETLACGTGACATLVAAYTKGVSGREAHVMLRGGELFIEWRASDGHILMTGPAEEVFQGEWKRAR